MKALLFDTETTGLVANHTLKLDLQPHVIEFYGCVADLRTGKVLDECATLIRPPKPEDVGQEITDITGLTFEMLAKSPTFEAVAPKLFGYIKAAPCVIAHNLSFDIEMMEIEAERINSKIAWPKLRLCTVEQTVHMKGYRLSLAALHELLFGEPHKGAHRAKADVMALLRCCVALHKQGAL